MSRVVVWDRPLGRAPSGEENAGSPRRMLVDACGGAVAVCGTSLAGPGAGASLAGGDAAISGAPAEAVWDSASARLVAATDPLGILPVYWAERDGRLAVGRSACAIARAAGGRFEPAPAAVAAHLLGRPLPAGASFFAGVRTVPPGHRLVAEAGSVAVEPCRDPLPAPGPTRPLDAVLADLGERLLAVVGRHRGRRLGVALSGGLDSAAVAAACARAGLGDTVALTWTAPGIAAADEEAAARRLAARLGLSLHAVRGDLHWPLSGGEAALAGRDRPLQIALPEVWDALLAAARDAGIEVLLTGAGGDQLFRSGTYFVPAEALFAGRWRSFAREMAALRRSDPRRWVGRTLRPLAVALLPRRRPWRRAPRWLRRELLAAAPPPPAESLSWLPHPVQRLRREMLDPARLAAPLHDLAERAEAFGVEIDHPLLDRRLVALALEIAGHDLVDRGREKWPLRRLLASWLPGEPVGEHSGRGASALIHHGLRQRGQEVAWSLLTSMQAAERGWVDEARLREAYRRYLAGGSDRTFWSAMTLEAWLRRNFGDAG